MAITGIKNIYVTSLDANDSSNEEGELGIFRFGIDGTIYRYINANEAIASGDALVVVGVDDTVLEVADASDTRPIEAIGQSTISSGYYGWVIYEGVKADVSIDGVVTRGQRIKAGSTAGDFMGMTDQEGHIFSRLHALEAGTTTADVKIR